MAEFLVAARDLPSGYRRGDPVVAVANGHEWGREEGLPNFWLIKVPTLGLQVAFAAVKKLYEPAQEGDKEFTAADPEDRRIRRHRSKTRAVSSRLTPQQRELLATTGEVTLTANQARNAFRRLTYSRTTQELSEGDREF